MAEFAPFAKATPGSKRLYTREGLSAHRRTLSNNTSPQQYQAFTSGRGHRRTMSNTATDFQQILSASPSADHKQTQEKPDNQHKIKGNQTKKGFLGTLEAAITYFNEQKPSFIPQIQQIPGEMGDLREEIDRLQRQISQLETLNDGLRRENDRLLSQKESISLSIGSLNTQILDLQLILEEQQSGAGKGRETKGRRLGRREE